MSETPIPLTPAWKTVSVLVLAILGVAALMWSLSGPATEPGMSVSTPTPTPAIAIVSPSIDPTKPDFDLGENLTFNELKAISERVVAEKARRKLSDKATLELSNQEIRRASIARWQQDGNKWVIRDESSPLYKK